MNTITGIHIASGMIALVSGAASILAPYKSPPESPIGGIMVCYFVATAWMSARRRGPWLTVDRR